MDHLSLRRVRQSDVKAIQQWFNGDRAGMRFVSSYRDASGWLQLISEQKRQGWIVWQEASRVGFLDLEKEGTTGYFSFYVSPHHRRQGLGVKLLAVMESLFREMKVVTVEGYFEPENTASDAALRKAGYELASAIDQEGMIKASKYL